MANQFKSESQPDAKQETPPSFVKFGGGWENS
jgi:hypothetical protein